MGIIATSSLGIAMRFNAQRDKNEMEIFRALQAAHCKPVRGRDVDIFAMSRTDMQGVLIEVKRPGKRKQLRPIQIELRALFGSRYVVCCTPDEALRACGVSL
jgi:hypothetical protein